METSSQIDPLQNLFLRQPSTFRRDVTWRCLFAGIGLAANLAYGMDERLGEVKNICFILAEDMGMQIPAYGDRTVPTPAMDRIAAEGVVMTNAYVTQATCSPSRASLFTGLYPHQHGHLGLANPFGYRLHSGTPTFLSTLHEAGYATALNYKIHVDPKMSIGFDRQIWQKEYDEWEFDDRDTRYMERVMDTFFSEVIAPGQPFYIQPQTGETHRPFIKNDREVDAKVLDYPGSPYRIVTAEDVELLPYFGPDMPKETWLMKDLAEYYNAIQRFDRAVGLVLEDLEERGLLDTTLVIVTADHGPTYGRGKLNLYELGMHVPMIVRWPGVTKPGTRNDALVSFIDMMPTFLDVAGLPVPDYLPGRSLRNLFEGKPWRTHLYGEYTAHTSIRHYWPSRMVRDDRYKLIWNMLGGQAAAGINPEGCPDIAVSLTAPEHSITDDVYRRFRYPPVYELYDLQKDPYELKNLAQIPAYAEVVTDLKRHLDNWMRDTVDPFMELDFLTEFTNAYRSREEKIVSYEKEHGFDSYWGKPVTRFDYSDWVKEFSDLRSPFIKAKETGSAGSF